MSHQTVAIKIKTPSGDRYFYGFGKGKSVQSAWSLAGAKLFLIGSNSEAKLNEITEYLKAKKKRFEIVEVSETKQEHFSYEAAQALSNLSVRHLGRILEHVFHRNQELKRYILEVEAHLEDIDYGHYETMKKDALAFDQLSLVLSNEVDRVVGI